MTFPPAPTLKPLDIARYPAPAPGEVASDPQHEQLVRSARQWVAQTFFGTLMKQMRQSPFRSDLFEGGRGGQAFTSLYDQKLIEQMARGAGNKLVNAIVHGIERNMRKAQAGAAYEKQKAAADGAEKQIGRAVEQVRGSAFNHVRANVPAAFRS
jgi:Rod binding domain-containing protein